MQMTKAPPDCYRTALLRNFSPRVTTKASRDLSATDAHGRKKTNKLSFSRKAVAFSDNRALAVRFFPFQPGGRLGEIDTDDAARLGKWKGTERAFPYVIAEEDEAVLAGVGRLGSGALAAE